MYIGFSNKQVSLVIPKKIFEEGHGQGCTRALVVSFNWDGVPVTAAWGCADFYFCAESSWTTYNLAQTTANIFPIATKKIVPIQMVGVAEPEADLIPLYFPPGNLVYRMPIQITSAFQPIPLFLLLGVKGP